MPEPKNELGYGDVDARPDLDGGGGAGGGESGGGARPEPAELTDGKGSPGGQTDPAYRGGDNNNATRKPATSTASGFVASGPAELD